MDKVMKTKKVELKTINKMVKVRTKNDIKAGEFIVFPIRYDVPVEVYNEWEQLNKASMVSEEEAKKKLI